MPMTTTLERDSSAKAVSKPVSKTFLSNGLVLIKFNCIGNLNEAETLPPGSQGDTGKIEFNNVEMRYKPDLRPALRNLTFKIDPGTKVAVVGRTGAGKSTIYQLLIGFRQTNEGQVLIDGYDADKLALKSLRSEINVVL